LKGDGEGKHKGRTEKSGHLTSLERL
jgi:hypothetical protein